MVISSRSRTLLALTLLAGSVKQTQTISLNAETCATVAFSIIGGKFLYELTKHNLWSDALLLRKTNEHNEQLNHLINKLSDEYIAQHHQNRSSVYHQAVIAEITYVNRMVDIAKTLTLTLEQRHLNQSIEYSTITATLEAAQQHIAHIKELPVYQQEVVEKEAQEELKKLAPSPSTPSEKATSEKVVEAPAAQ